MSRHLQHPLLRNPAKWLRGITKRHSESLYVTDRYDSSSLNANPFALLLQQTRKDVSGYRFPLGNMVQVIVKRKSKEVGAYELVPVLEKPAIGQHPASYVINNRTYVDLLKARGVRPIPLKHKQRNASLMSQLQLLDSFADDIERLYEKDIEKGLDDISNGLESEIGPAMILQPCDGHNSQSFIGWKLNTPVLRTSSVGQEILVPYKTNEKLCAAAVKSARFKQSISK